MKVFKYIKETIGGITWPSFKKICGETTFTVIATVILSVAIWLWIAGIDSIIDVVVHLL